MKPRPWTHSELVILRKLYPSAPQGRVVASLPERTWGAIRRAAVGAGIRRVAPRPHWTKAEDAALRKLYPSAPQRQVRAALPGRRWHAVQRRAAKLGVRRVAGARPWTGEDVRALREMWPEHARRTIRERLGRSWDAIAKRAFLLGLARRRDGSTPAMRWAGYISIAEAARRCGYERRSFLIALRAYQRHFKTIPQGPGRAELPSPKPIVRGKSGRCVQRVVDEQAAVDAVEWWLRQETVSAAAARLGVKHRALFAAAKRCGARLKKYARREPAWWDDVAARGARGTR